MALPKIQAPVFTVTLPSNNKEMKFRPFTVKEEKLLLMATQSQDTKQVNDTIKQVLTNCFFDELDVDDMATFDVEYMFLQLRAKSVDNKVELKIKDDEDENYYDIDVDLNNAIVVFDPKHKNKIALNDEVTIVMKYPSFKSIENMTEGDSSDLVKLMAASIDKVVSGDDLMDLKDFPDEEVTAFIESFTSKNMRDVEAFFETMPKLKMSVDYVTRTGTKKTKEVVGLQSFFTS